MLPLPARGDPRAVVRRMTTADNKAHLAPDFMEAVVARYRGSVLGRQELDGEMIEDLPGALWQRGMFRRFAGGDIGRIVVAVDPPATGNATSDACGIVVAGRVGEGVVILADCTLGQARPMDWARRAVMAYAAHRADGAAGHRALELVELAPEVGDRRVGSVLHSRPQQRRNQNGCPCGCDHQQHQFTHAFGFLYSAIRLVTLSRRPLDVRTRNDDSNEHLSRTLPVGGFITILRRS